jgi:hypothetical protein
MCKGWPSQVLQSSTTNHNIGLPKVLEHENCCFWEVFWNNWDPSNSLILFILPKTETGCSWILKFIKNWNQHSSFINSNISKILVENELEDVPAGLRIQLEFLNWKLVMNCNFISFSLMCCHPSCVAVAYHGVVPRLFIAW